MGGPPGVAAPHVDRTVAGSGIEEEDRGGGAQAVIEEATGEVSFSCEQNTVRRHLFENDTFVNPFNTKTIANLVRTFITKFTIS